MKRQLIFTIILVIPLLSIGQIDLNQLSNEYCECFKKINNQSEKKVEIFLKKCLAEKNELFSSKDLTKLFLTAQSQIEFLKDFARNCDQFNQYLTKTLPKGENISDKESTKEIYRILGYFSPQNEMDKLTKTVNIQPDEIGILHNIFLDKISMDTIFKSGTHIIPHHNTLIAYNVSQQQKLLSLSALLIDSEVLKIKLKYWYNLKQNSVVNIHNKIGREYEDKIIIPSIRSSVRKVLRNYTSKDLSQMEKEEIGNLILAELNQMKGLIELFSINSIIVDEL